MRGLYRATNHLGLNGLIIRQTGRLRYVLRAITPTQSPIRFNARFFLADAACASGELKGNGELLDLAWRPIEASLELQIVDVTQFLLEGLLKKTFPGSGRVPLFCFRNGKSRLL